MMQSVFSACRHLRAPGYTSIYTNRLKQLSHLSGGASHRVSSAVLTRLSQLPKSTTTERRPEATYAGAIPEATTARPRYRRGKRRVIVDCGVTLAATEPLRARLGDQIISSKERIHPFHRRGQRLNTNKAQQILEQRKTPFIIYMVHSSVQPTDLAFPMLLNTVLIQKHEGNVSGYRQHTSTYIRDTSVLV